MHQLTKGRAWFRVFLRLTSITVNSVLADRIAMLVLDGTLRGPMVMAAPVLLGLASLLNVVAAVIGLDQASVRHACERCGYDTEVSAPRVARNAVCPSLCHPIDQPRARDDHSCTARSNKATSAKASDRTTAIRPTSGAPDPRANGMPNARSPSRRTVLSPSPFEADGCDIRAEETPASLPGCGAGHRAIHCL